MTFVVVPRSGLLLGGARRWRSACAVWSAALRTRCEGNGTAGRLEEAGRESSEGKEEANIEEGGKERRKKSACKFVLQEPQRVDPSTAFTSSGSGLSAGNISAIVICVVLCWGLYSSRRTVWVINEVCGLHRRKCNLVKRHREYKPQNRRRA